jgi:hypothetical protein
MPVGARVGWGSASELGVEESHQHNDDLSIWPDDVGKSLLAFVSLRGGNMSGMLVGWREDCDDI